jgi:predicted GIY-YIG superfamily endonuclease
MRVPVALINSEECSNYSVALKREAQIKRWTKQKKLALINGDISHLHNLAHLPQLKNELVVISSTYVS